MDNKRIALIDADSIVWSIAWDLASNGGSFRTKLTDWFYEMFNYLHSTHYIGILGSHELGRRKAIVPSYKANRPPKPEFYLEFGPPVEQYLLNEWKFVYSEAGYEADDEIASIAAICRKENIQFDICAIDKDLLQIEGQHYNYKKKTNQNITEAQADRNLLLQTLSGDSSDNIPGLPGIGAVKAAKIIDQFHSSSMWSNAILAYTEKYGARLGLAKFAECYLMVRLEDNLPVDIDKIIQEIEYPV